MPILSRRFRSLLLAGTALTIAAVAMPNIAHAATAVYDGAGATTSTGAYSTGSNYDTSTAPSSTADTAVFNDTSTVAKTTTITFTNATNPLGTLSFTGGTAYTFTLATGQAFNPTVLSNASTANQTFNLAGTGSMTIGSVTNTGGITTFNTTGTGAAVITGAASIGTSTLTYTGNAASIGGAFTSAGGNLVLSGVTSGTSTIASIAGSGTVQLGGNALSVGGAGSTTTYSGVISGTNGSLALTGGNLTLSGTNTYTGATSVTNATLTGGVANTIATSSGLSLTTGTFNLGGFNQSVANLAGNAGSTVTLGANALTVTGTGNTTFAGVIGGTGTLTYAGTGTLNLTGTNTFTGATTINNGATINDANSAIANASNIGVSGTLQFTNTGTSTYSGVLSGAGGVQVLGGTEILSGANTFTGNTLITNAATLSVGAGSADLGSSITFGTGAGTLTTTSAITTANAVTLTGNGAINTSGNNDTFSGAVTGAGGLTKVGTGNLTLSNTGNTYSGGTSLIGGTVTIAANNAAGSGALSVGGGTTFIMNGFSQVTTGFSGAGAITSTGGALTSSGSGTFTGTITSTSTMVKTTGGLQILDGASTFGSTTIAGGSLEIGDAADPGAVLTGPTTVQTAGTLLGHGTVVGNVVNYGTVSPGGTIGTLTVSGNYQMTPGSTLAIELNPTTSSQLSVTGTAGLGGTLALTPDAGLYRTGTQYTILTAGGGVAGRFANDTDTSNSVIFATTYYPNSVVLTAVNLNQPFVSETPNEANVAGAIRSIVPTVTNTPGFLSGLAGIYGTAQLGGNAPQVADALGELRADAATVVLANTSGFQNILIDRMSQRQGLTNSRTANNGLPGTFDVAMNDTDMPLFGPSGSNSVVELSAPTVWVHGYGVLGDVGGESGYANFQTRTGGIVGGIDSKVSDRALIGAAVAYEHTDYNLSGLSDENNIDTYRVSLYGSSKLDPIPLVADAAVGYAYNDYHNNSFLPMMTGTGYTQTSRHDGNTLTAEGGLSHAFSIPQNVTTGKLTLIPRAGLEYDNIEQSDFSTTGAPVRALDIHSEGSTLNALRSTIGGKADLDFKTNNGTLITPEVRASYLHDYMDTNVALTENFTGAGAAGFNISGVRPGRDAALVGTGVTVAFNTKVSANISYDADVRDHELDNIIQAGVKYTW